MDSSLVTKLEKILSELNTVDGSFNKNGVSSHFIELEKAGAGEFVINGNSEGLIHVACKILELAVADVEGRHHHFDESGMVDKCEMPLVVTLKNTDWS